MKNRKTNPMKKDITFRFTDGTSPGTEVTLSGRRGRSLGMTLSDGRSMTSVSLDADSVVRLRTFTRSTSSGRSPRPRRRSTRPREGPLPSWTATPSTSAPY